MGLHEHRQTIADEHGSVSAHARWLWSAMSDFAVAAVFYAAWWNPRLLPDSALRAMVMVVVLEMLAIAAIAGMAVVVYSVQHRVARAGCFLLATSWSLLGAVMFGLFLKSWEPLAAYVVLLFNRGIPLLRSRRDDHQERLLIVNAAMTGAAFFVCLFGAGYIAFPALGVTPEIARIMRVSPPEGAVAVMSFNAFYYTAAGIVALATPVVADALREINRSPREAFYRRRAQRRGTR